MVKTWEELIDNEFKKPYFKELWKKVEQERVSKEIFPAREEIFSCFEKCPIEKTKVVIIGQDPYHGVGQAHGMSFSVKKGVKIPPSLRNIYKELHDDLGVEIPSHGNLEDWARQGVLLLNTSFSVEKGKPASHANFGWLKFSENILDFLKLLITMHILHILHIEFFVIRYYHIVPQLVDGLFMALLHSLSRLMCFTAYVYAALAISI